MQLDSKLLWQKHITECLDKAEKATSALECPFSKFHMHLPLARNPVLNNVPTYDPDRR